MYKGVEGEGSALTGLQKTGLILAKVVVTRHPSKRLGASSLPSVGSPSAIDRLPTRKRFGRYAVSGIKVPSSSTITRAVVAGAPAEFSALLRSFEPHLRATAFHSLRSGIDLDDLEQAGRIALWRSTAKPDARRGIFINYARRAVKNAIRSEVRCARPVSDAGEPRMQPIGDATEDLEDHRDRLDSLDFFAILRVRRWLETLPLTLRNLFALIYRNGLSQRDAARILQVSQPRVAQLHTELLRRGREALAELAA